ncbi:hypothetical protein HDU91_003852 [Kappamyces sp. JEL0680]|nr:hypothetical protein HDU91_003852 [Kappamyces sp. JEL0680]
MEMEIFKSLSKKHGLKINNDAINYLASFFKENGVDQENLQDSLDFIAREWIHTHSNGFAAAFILADGIKTIEKAELEVVIQSALQKRILSETMQMPSVEASGLDISQLGRFLKVFDTFRLPKYYYVPEDKTFQL